MKKLFFSILFFFAIKLLVSQDVINLKDLHSEVAIGTTIRIPALTYTNAINKYYFNQAVFDTLVLFLKANPTIKIELHCFSDFTEVPLMNLMATADQANDIRNYMVTKGIDGTRIITVGNGDMFPIHDESSLAKMSDTERMNAETENRRIEVVIIKKGS